MNDERRERVHLLLSAGGVRCLAYIGALQQLEREGFEIATVSTCSAGTLVGALYCCGVPLAAMREAALELDLRRLAGDARWKWIRRLRTLRSWPALYPKPGIPHVFAEILEGQRLEPEPKLRELHPPLSTAAVDVAARRLLVYSTERNPDMTVAELLSIATAIPLVYPPHEREGREILDASLASYTPIWLATGQAEDLPIVVLRSQQPERTKEQRKAPGTKRLPAWVNEIMSGAVGSRDTFLLERMAKVNVFDIPSQVSAFDFDLSRTEIEKLIDAGRWAVADQLERRQEPIVTDTSTPDDDIAEGRAAELYAAHLDRVAGGRTATVFLSYAREDRRWVERLRGQLGELLADTDVTVWYDDYIKPSSLWGAAIEDAIRRARVAVLFVSERFEKSDFIRRVERPLLRAHLGPGRLLCISIDGTLPSGREEALQVFANARALESMRETEADETLQQFGRLIEQTYRAAVTAA